MPFTKGQSGNPGGKPKSKPFADMLRIAVNEATEDGGKKLRALADALVSKAVAGDVQAIKEVADRLDGKPAQQIIASGDPDNPIEHVHRDAERFTSLVAGIATRGGETKTTH